MKPFMKLGASTIAQSDKEHIQAEGNQDSQLERTSICVIYKVDWEGVLDKDYFCRDSIKTLFSTENEFEIAFQTSQKTWKI